MGLFLKMGQYYNTYRNGEKNQKKSISTDG